MKKIIRFLVTAYAASMVYIPLSFAETVPELWEKADSSIHTEPEKFPTFQLKHSVLNVLLSPEGGGEISLPMPDGTLSRFSVQKTDVIPPELAEKFPEIKTFSGEGIDDPGASVKFDLTADGFRAQILGTSGAVYIEPIAKGETNFYATSYKHDLTNAGNDFTCLVEDAVNPKAQSFSLSSGRTRAAVVSGNVLRTYRIAVAASGEYTAFHGGASGAMAAIVTAINRVNGIYERDVGIRFTLVANNDKIIFTSAASDPYSANAPTKTTLLENQATMDRIIGSANYDLGIVFNTGNLGLAQIRSVCSPQYKAHACIGLPNPSGDAFLVGLVAHEIAHMFGAEHTFNGVGGNCAANRSAHMAYEPGGGSTVMAYAGLCGGDNFQTQADPYFHIASIDQIRAFILGSGGDCATVTPLENQSPVVTAPSGFTIPKGTPFKLKASGNDPNGDSITYCWEQFDLGPAQSLSASDNGSSPLFRSFPPTFDPSRTFPRVSDILRNRLSLGEKLPMTDRVMNFRVTARDNQVGGGVESSQASVAVHGGAGPFVITSPGGSTKWFGLRSHQVTWNVANTSVAPIHTAFVRILLSTDGGTGFNIVLAERTPNDGSEHVTLPDTPTAQARIKVEAIDNIFFDISDGFSIEKIIAPELTIHPESQSVVLGEVGFSVSAAGTPPFNYQWQYNEQDIAGATGSAFAFTVSSAAQSGPYRVRVANEAGFVFSDVAQLTVVVELVKPTIALNGNLLMRVDSAAITVSGTAGDNAGLREVRWRINQEPFQIASGTANWSAAVTLVPGTNVFEAISIDTSGNESPSATRKVFYVVTSPLTVSANGNGSIKPNLNAQNLEIGGGYKIVAKANKGHVFAGWSGGIAASEPELNFVMQSNLVLQANFIPNPFTTLKGIYSGLFFETNQVFHENSGLLTLKISNQGKFTGKIFVSGKPYSFSGAFNGIGETTRTIRIGRTNSLTASLRMDMTNGADTIVGNIFDATWNAELSANRSVFNARSNPAPHAGKYTAILRGDMASTESPEGTSFATLAVSAAGALRMSGTLADGSRVTQATVISKNGEWPFYVPLYKGKGSALGWIHFAETETNSLGGAVSWIKSADVKAKLFAAGFTNDAVLTGSSFVGANGSPVLNLTSGMLVLSNGNLPVPLVNGATLNKNKISVLPSPEKVALTINKGSGLASGSFIHPETRKRHPIKGVVIQKQNRVEGFFIGTDQSGTLLLEEN